jgi:hypothetical protein
LGRAAKSSGLQPLRENSILEGHGFSRAVNGLQPLRENSILEGHGFNRAVNGLQPLRENSIPGRARLQPCRKVTLQYSALAAEVRFFHPVDSLVR